MKARFEALKERFAEIADLQAASAVLQWDQETYMPPGGGASRADALATLQKAAHERLVADETSRLLDEAETWARDRGPDSFEAGFLRAARRDQSRAKKLPGELVAELAKAASVALEAWREARTRSDFSLFAPHLDKIVGLLRRKAEALAVGERLYDSLLDEYEPDMRTSQVESAFRSLREGLVPIVKQIVSRQDRVSNAVLCGACGEKSQFKLCQEVVRCLGYDFDRGRQDLSAHAFTQPFSTDDVRITTRIKKDFLPASLYASIHECGHALYAQGIDKAFNRAPLNDGASLGVHESQSRLWENVVGRSRVFCAWLLPLLQKRFPKRFSGLGGEEFYRAVNKAGPSLIRVEADEVTYNLHVLLRFELEADMIEGRLKVCDAPQAWNAKMADYLGITPPDHAQGILQDIHWAAGLVGYFPTYTLGNILSVQFYEKARRDIPGLEGGIAQGDFAPLRNWLGKNIHRHGRKYTPNELLERILGGGLDSRPFLDYLRAKYSEIYGFNRRVSGILTS
ncbi:MAG: carboxypeptidase M32 [Elusimicrobia bacterium]|nr:carboxypeptidase M32 [Elusimicrobiota bacterium]